MTTVLLPVTNQKLLQQATLTIKSLTNKYEIEKWRSFNQDMTTSNKIFIGRDDPNKKCSKSISLYFDEFFDNIFQQICINFDKEFDGLNAMNVFQKHNKISITNQHQPQIIKINSSFLIKINNDFAESDYNFKLIEYMVKQFNYYFAQQEFQISFRPQWLLVADDDNQYQLMLDENSLVKQLVDLQQKLLKKAQQLIQMLSSQHAHAINRINKQVKQLITLMYYLQYNIANEHDIINNSCDFDYYIGNEDYLKNTIQIIKNIHQSVKQCDDDLVHYLNNLGIDNIAIKKF